MKKYFVGPTEPLPSDVIDLYYDSVPDEWILNPLIDPTEAAYCHKGNCMLQLWRNRECRYDLRYGYQTVGTVGGIGCEVVPEELEVVRIP